MAVEILKLYAVKPTKTTDLNLCTNPSIGSVTTGWTTGGTNTIILSDDRGYRGSYSLKCTYSNNDLLASYAITLTAAAYTASMDIYIPTNYDGTELTLTWTDYAGSAVVAGLAAMSIRDKWQRIHAHITPVGGDLVGTLTLSETGVNATATRFIYIDGIQIELRSEPSTYFDGNSIDCYWNGTANLSTSTRKSTTRRGGTLVNIEDYLSISTIAGLGMGPFYSAKTPTLSGRSMFQKTLKSDREIVISGEILGANYDELQTARQGLIDLFKPDYVTGDQDVTLRYIAETAAGVQASEPVDFRVRLRPDGLLGNWTTPTFERVSLIFECYDDPTRDGEESKTLGYQTTVSNMGNIMQRSSDGTWAAVGTGLNEAVRCMAIHPITGELYLGGGFTNVNGTATTDYLVKWTGSAFVQVVASLSASVLALAFAANGDLYIGGNFTNAGDANGDYIVKWDGSALSSLGTGTNGVVSVITISDAGIVYVGGDFALAGGVADTVRLASWDGAAFSPIGTGVNAYMSAIAIDKNGDLYIGGNFTNAGGVAEADYIAKISGSTYTALGTGMDTYVREIIVADDGNVYIGGFFTTANGGTAKYITVWNGSTFSQLNTGLNNYVYGLFLSKNGDLYAGGTFTGEYSGITFPDRLAVWNRSVWMGLDINVDDIAATGYCFTENENTGILYVGGGWSTTDAISATVTTSAVSGTTTYPKIVITGPGSIWQIKNYTNGKAIFFDGLTLLAGEVITLDFEQQSYTSTFRGNILNYIIEGISTLDFQLEPGSNNVSAYLYGSTDAASKIVMTYKVRYWSVDEAQL